MRREAIKRKISATVSTAAAVHILIIFSFEFLRIYFPDLSLLLFSAQKRA